MSENITVPVDDIGNDQLAKLAITCLKIIRNRKSFKQETKDAQESIHIAISNIDVYLG